MNANIAILPIVLIAFASAHATTLRLSLSDKLNSHRLPAAPFLTAKIHPLDVLDWLPRETALHDPEGTGIKILIEVPDDRGPIHENTMARWYDHQFCYETLPFPQIKNICIQDYIAYLTKQCGWQFRVTQHAVIIFSLAQDQGGLRPQSKRPNMCLPVTSSRHQGRFLVPMR